MYLEDYYVNQSFNINPIKFTKEDIIKFAEKYDPRPFHLSDEGASKTRFKKLFASGFMTLTVCWSEWVKTEIDAAGVIAGMGLDEVKWLKPVFADDVLTSVITIGEVIVHEDKPTGVVRWDMQTKNQNDEVVLTLKARGLISKKPVK